MPTAYLNGKEVNLSVSLARALSIYGEVDGTNVKFDNVTLVLNGNFAIKEAPPQANSSALRVVNWPAQLASKKFCGKVTLTDGALVFSNLSGKIEIFRGKTVVNYPTLVGFVDDTAALTATLQVVPQEKIDSLFASPYFRGQKELKAFLAGEGVSPASSLILAHGSLATLCTLSDAAKLGYVSCSSGFLLSNKVMEFADRLHYCTTRSEPVHCVGESISVPGEIKIMVPNSSYLKSLFSIEIPPGGGLIVTTTRLTGFKDGTSPEKIHKTDAEQFCDRLEGREVAGWVGGMASSPRFYIMVSEQVSQDVVSPSDLFKFLCNLYASAVEVVSSAVNGDPCPTRVITLGDDFDLWTELDFGEVQVEFTCQ